MVSKTVLRSPSSLPSAASPSAASRPAPVKRAAAGKAAAEPAAELRERILDTASRLFYERGVRAVGVDLVVQEAVIAKTSLYRYFPTKDDLIVAFLEREDQEFWALWDSVAEAHAEDPAGELAAHLRWIGARLARANYRGCPQINVAAEFAEQDHPARRVAQRHMLALRGRLQDIARRLEGVRQPDRLAAQLAVLVNGAFVSSGLLDADEATEVLLAALQSLLDGARGRRG
ncbi:TetR/AcrR family transcriptional regulator [Roseateles sp. DAIF2]|nr:TetR/AcrR family transcriptional regulator [Roseateles sp. DAIF2]